MINKEFIKKLVKEFKEGEEMEEFSDEQIKKSLELGVEILEKCKSDVKLDDRLTKEKKDIIIKFLDEEISEFSGN